jgi:hypothetical protein
MKRPGIAISVFFAALLTAYSAQAADAVASVGSGAANLITIRAEIGEQAILIHAIERKIEAEAPINQSGKRKDTTSASIRKASGEPQKNAPEKTSANDRTQIKKEETPIENKFGIYASIKDAVLDFFYPSRKEAPKKVDLSRIQRSARTEQAKQKQQTEPVK